MAQGQGNGSGGPGQGSGARPPGKEESVGFKREKINANGLNAGDPISVVETEGESLEGKVSLPVGNARRSALNALAEEVKDEPLPISERELVLRYQEHVLQGLKENGDADGDESGSAESGSDAGSGERE